MGYDQFVFFYTLHDLLTLESGHSTWSCDAGNWYIDVGTGAGTKLEDSTPIWTLQTQDFLALFCGSELSEDLSDELSSLKCRSVSRLLPHFCRTGQRCFDH